MGKSYRVGYFPGAWDFLHAGHVKALEEAKEYCDYLVVGIGENPQIGNPYKNIPIMTLYERYVMLKGNKFVDAVIAYDSEHDSIEIDKWFPYDVRFMGEDHKGEHSARIKKPIVYI